MALKQTAGLGRSYVTIQAFAETFAGPTATFRSLAWMLSHTTTVRPQDVGLCVSGGPDSMALAYLMYNMPHPLDKSIKAFSPHAFIVDHGVRLGSRDEALQVKEVLQERGVPATVLTIKWPHGAHPGQMTGFEGAARQARYQLIVQRALSQNCYHLCTGHHLDDQMETILSRVIRNKTSNILGLQGMAGTSAVPCSNNIPEANPYHEVFGIRSAESVSQCIGTKKKRTNQGILLHRPLLSFSKSQLVDTCKHFGIPYVNDKTNLDRTHNNRNAIRYLRSRPLPKALGNQSLIALRDQAVEAAQDAEKRAINLSEDAFTFRIHNQIGSVEVLINHSKFYSDLVALRYLLARLVELVSPLPAEQSPILVATELVQRLTEYDPKTPRADSLRSGVLTSKVVIQALPIVNVNQNLEQRLILYRQPMRQAEIKQNKVDFIIENEEENLSVDGDFKSQYIFWDHRFWIRISARDSNVIRNTQVRVLNQEDVLKVRKEGRSKLEGIGNTETETFDRTLFPRLPAKIKYTLPVLTYCGEIIALPTLGLVLGDRPCPLKWEVSSPRSSRCMNLFGSLTDLT